MAADLSFTSGAYGAPARGLSLVFSFGTLPTNSVVVPAWRVDTFGAAKMVARLAPTGVAVPVFGRPGSVAMARVELAFSAATYSPPGGTSLGFKFTASAGGIAPFGILPGGVGSHRLKLTVRPVGIADLALSSPPVVSRATQSLIFSAFDAKPIYGIPFHFGTVSARYLMPYGPAGVAGYPTTKHVVNAPGIPPYTVAKVAVSRAAVNLAFTADTYSAPTGGVVFSFSGGLNVAAPTSAWSGAIFGNAQIRNRADVVTIGWNSAIFGPHYVNLGAAAIHPQGFTASAFGVPFPRLALRRVAPGGVTGYAVGNPTVTLRNRYLNVTGLVLSGYGAQRVEHERRTLLGSGYANSGYGTPKITNANRTVFPSSIGAIFASNHMVGGLRFLHPIGFDAARYLTRIIPEIQATYPRGFAGVFGQALIENRRQLIKPPGFITVGIQPADRWGTAHIYNLRQYVTQVYDPISDLTPPVWPQWTLIENRTRVMRVTGLFASRVGVPYIFNNATPLYPAPIEAPAKPLDYKAGMIAYRQRTYRLDGIEPPYMSTWGRVYNGARVLAPAGMLATLFGRPGIVNTRRTFDHIGGFDAAWFGYPMVADRIRTLTFEGRYTIGAPVIALPEVKLYTRYVDGIGKDTAGIGSPSLSIHWTLITPRWTHQNLFGFPAVKNNTPELHTRGRASDEFGDTSVRLQWRPVSPEGTLTQLFGRTDIAFRDRRMTVTGFRAGAIGDKLTVVKTGAPPYSTQFIDLSADVIAGEEPSGWGYGIAPPDPQVGQPIMNQQVLYVHQIDASTLFGNPRITANTLRVEPGYQELLVGEPMVSLKIRTLTVAAFPNDAVYQPSRARLSPHTIYAVVESSEQARLNHPSSSLALHYVDGWGKPPGVIFGRPEVTLRQRRVWVPGEDGFSWRYGGYGRPVVQNQRAYIQPNGIGSLRFGWHEIPGPRTLEQFDSSYSTVFGTPKVARPPYVGPQTIRGIGLASQAFGTLLIEFFNREVKPVGLASQAMGTKRTPDSPYMWQGLRVGPLMPTIPTGVEMSLFGVPWVSFRVREVLPTGFDAFLAEYQLEAFDRRMRVARRAIPRPVRTITPVGISAFAASASDVRPGVHFIRPDGNADQFRKGAF